MQKLVHSLGAKLLCTLVLASCINACTTSPTPSPPVTPTAQLPRVSTQPTIAPTITRTPAVVSISATSVIKFTPTLPSGQARSGYCWTNSVAAGWRSDAWRCMIENSIFDPCFSIKEGIAVCDANPAAGEAGFQLRLTKPLPPSSPSPQTASRAWLIQLTNGTYCSAATGAVPMIKDKRPIMYCTGGAKDESVVIFEALKPGQIWTAEWAVLTRSPSGTSIKESKVVPLRTVWQ